MKIPQREDQVQLDAPRTQAGQAVQPVEGSLGDSYVTAMRGMAKELNELSDLQFDLSKNQLQGQLNSFDIYVDARTKQYNQELALATTAEQINDLFGKYQADISNTGTEMLGNRLYQNWFNAKGGTTVVGANYSANLTNAQLMIKQNNEVLNDQGRELNTLAGTARTAKERQKYVNQYYDVLNQNVKNGTITEAKAQEMKRQFDYNLTSALVVKSMEDDPYATAQALRGDPNFAPILTFPDRMRLASEALREYQSRIGTGKAKVSRDWMDYWGRLQQNPKGTVRPAIVPKLDKSGNPVLDSKGNLVLEENKDADVRLWAAAAIKASNDSLFGVFSKWVSAVTGVPESELHEEDLRQIREQQIRLVRSDFSADTLAFNENFSAFKQQNQLMFNSGMSKEGKDTSIPPSNWGISYEKMNGNGRLDRDASKLFTQYNNAKQLTQNVEGMVLLGTGEDRAYVDSVKSGIISTFLADLHKDKLNDEGIYKEFKHNLKVLDERLDAAGGIYGDKTQAEYRFLSYILENYDVEKLLNSKNQTEKMKAITAATGFAMGVSPSDMWKKERKGNELLLSDTPAFAITSAMYMSEGKKSWANVPMPSLAGYNVALGEFTEPMREVVTIGDVTTALADAAHYPLKKAGEAIYEDIVDTMAGNTPFFSKSQDYEAYAKQVQETARKAEEKYQKRKGSSK